MGYDLHITRSKDWSSNKGQEITPAEWLEVIRGDPSLSLDESQGSHFALWAGDKERGKSGHPEA
jgi:hypothetical protein